MAVTRLNTNTASHVASGTLSRAVTINSGGSNVAAFAVLAFDSNGSIGNYVINSVTLGGQAMTQCGTPILQTYGVACYYLVNPPTGSQTLAASISNATEIYSNLVVYQGVDQTTPVRSGSYSSGNANNRTITSAVGDLTTTVVNGGPSGVSSTNQTSDGVDAGGNFGMGSDHATTSASSVTHTWTGPSGTSCGILGFSIQAAGAGGTNYAKALNASMSAFSAITTKNTGQVLSASTTTMSGITAKGIVKPISASTNTFSAILAASRTRLVTLIASTAAFSASVSKSVGKKLTGSSATFSAQLPRSVAKALSAATAQMSAGVKRSVSKVLAASLSPFSGATSKSVAKFLIAGMSTMSAVINAAKNIVTNAYTVTLTASMALFNGSIPRRVGKALAASTATFSATRRVALSKQLLASTSTFSGSTLKAVSKKVTASTAQMSAVVYKSVAKKLSGSMAQMSASLLSGKFIAYVVNLTANMATFSGGTVRQIDKQLSASAATFDAAINRATDKLLLASLAVFTATTTKASTKFLEATLPPFAASIAESLLHKIQGTAFIVWQFFRGFRMVRDTFLHFLADNLGDITVHPVRVDVRDRSTASMQINALNVSFGTLRFDQIADSEVYIDVLHDDENTAIDWISSICNLLGSAFYTPLLNYSDPNDPKDTKVNVLWEPPVVFQRVENDNYCHYSATIRLRFQR